MELDAASRVRKNPPRPLPGPLQSVRRLLELKGQKPHIVLVWAGLAIAVASVVSDALTLVGEDQQDLATIDFIRVGASVASSTYLCLVLLRPQVAPLFLVLSWFPILFDPAPGGLIPFVYLGLAFAAFTSRGRTIAVSLGVTLIWAAIWVPWTSNLPNEALWGYLPVTVAFVVPGIAVQMLTEQVVSERRRREGAETATALARVQERKNLARELHDIVAHELTIIAMQARAGGMSRDLDDAHQSLQVIGDSARSGLEEMRRLIAVMRADGAARAPSDPNDAAGHVTDLVQAINQARDKLTAVDIPTTVQIIGDTDEIPVGLRVTVAAVLREGTTNVIKHAGLHATCAVSLTVTRAHVEFFMRNTVPGESLNFPTSGFGLVGVRERVDVLGGELISQPEGSEWLLGVRLPLLESGGAPGISVA